MRITKRNGDREWREFISTVESWKRLDNAWNGFRVALLKVIIVPFMRIFKRIVK